MSASQANALGYAFNRLQESGQIPASAEGYVVDGNYSDNYGEANALLDSADLLIVTDSMYSSELIDFNANAIIPSLLEMIDTAHNNGTPVIAISCALPYDLPLLTSADALMAVYNQTGVVACDENFMPTAAYGPNIIGAMDVIFGKANPSGKLPVNIPVIENGTFTDGIAYERGTGLTW
jgi:beta-N-acetylhexosaminidase